MLSLRRSVSTAALLMAGALAGLAQQLGNLSFAYQGPKDATPVAIGIGGTIPFPATSVGSSGSVMLFVTNKGAGSITITESIINNNAFTIAPTSPVALSGAGSSTAYALTFSPKISGTVTATLSMTLASGEIATFQLSGTGVAPILITSYVMAPDGNQVVIQDQGTIQFPDTATGQTTTAAFVITNRGTGPGTVSSAALLPSSSPAFKITGLQLLPADVNANSELRFNITFTPTNTDLQTGTLQVVMQGVTHSFLLSGKGSGALYTYQAIAGGTTTTIPANGTVTFPATNIGSSSTLNLRITNSGNATGQIAVITVNGGAFQRTDTLALPITLPAGAAVVITLIFTPNDVGTITGTLIVGSSVLNLQGNGLGAKFSFAFRSAGTSVPVSNNGTVNFPNTNVGSQSTALLDITNVGNQDGTISSGNITGNGYSAVFPTLPTNIGVGKTLTITLAFTPNAVGALTGTLTIDSYSINLRGVGGTPAPVSGYSFAGTGNTVAPLSQPSVGLELSQPYPVDITGQLTLSFTSASFSDDPSIQFATGGRTVNFRIPANTTAAIFGGNNNRVQFQSGTVAGTIVITPSFSLEGVDITPQPVQTQSITVPPGAPQLTSVQIGSLSAFSIQLLVTGFSTTRSVNSLVLQITPAASANVLTTAMTADVTSAFSTWYSTDLSKTVGSQFTATVTITATGGNTDAVKAIAITASNGNGNSQPVSITLH